MIPVVMNKPLPKVLMKVARVIRRTRGSGEITLLKTDLSTGVI